MPQKRQPKGQSGGGQFAPDANPESAVALDGVGVFWQESEYMNAVGQFGLLQVDEVLDTVVVFVDYENNNGRGHWSTQFYRRRPGVFAGTPDAMRIQANRPLSDEEMRKMAGLVGYAYRSTIAGESIGDPVRDSPFSFVVYADMTKSSRDDLGMALEDFEEALPRVLAEGSPVRKTDRAGSGTQGTRLVEGFGSDLKFELYYDDVVEFNEPSLADNRV